MVHGVELGGGDVRQGDVGGDARVVDEDVDLELVRFRVGEVVFGGGDDVGWGGGLAEVGLDGDGFDAVRSLEFGREVGGFLRGAVGCVVED